MEYWDELRSAFRASVVICAAIIASLFLYAVIIQILKSQLNLGSGLVAAGSFAFLRYIFYGAAIAAVLLSRFLLRRLARPAERETPRQAIQKLSRATVMACVLGEVPALVGIILFFLSGSSRDFTILLVVSLFLQFMYFPRIKAWQDALRERYPGLDPR